jgi:hypothetical protein
MTHGRLLADIDRFIADTGMGEAYFGRRAVNDGKLIRRLRQGRPIETGTVDKIDAFMRAERERRERAVKAPSKQREIAA